MFTTSSGIRAEEPALGTTSIPIISVEVSGDPAAMRFQIKKVDSKLAAEFHLRAFLLPSPPRFVVDLLDEPVDLAPTVLTQHEKLLSLRWGEHPDYRRIVIDLTELPTQVVTQSNASGFFGELRFNEFVAVGSEFDLPTLTISKRQIAVIPQDQVVSDTVVTNTAKSKRSFVLELEPKLLAPQSVTETTSLAIAPKKFDLDSGKSQTIRLVSAAIPRTTESNYVLRVKDTTVGASSNRHHAQVDIRLLPVERLERVTLSEIGHTLLLENEGTVQATISGTICSRDETTCSSVPATTIAPQLSLMVQRNPGSQFRGRVRFDTREQQLVYPNL